VEPGELGLERSHCDSVRFRVLESTELDGGTRSRFPSYARRRKPRTARVLIGGKRWATEPKHQR